MRKIFLFLMSFVALAVVVSCSHIVQGSYRAKLYQVEEMFNGSVAQTITTEGSFKENGVTWLQTYVSFVIREGAKEFDGSRSNNYEVEEMPIGDNKAPCNLLWEKNGNSVFECYFFTDHTKKENCTWIDNFMWADIYQDNSGYLYRFGEDGTAVQLSRVKNSKGKWVYWDCLRAYYKFASEIKPDE